MVSKVMPPIWRLLLVLTVASSVSIGLATLPIPETIGELNVATSLLTVLTDILIPPVAALPFQLLVLFQAELMGVLVQVWFAAKIVSGLKSRTSPAMAETVA